MSICLSVDMYYTFIYIWGSVTIAPDSNQTGCLQSGVCLSENVHEIIFFVVKNHTSPSICFPATVCLPKVAVQSKHSVEYRHTW